MTPVGRYEWYGANVRAVEFWPTDENGNPAERTGHGGRLAEQKDEDYLLSRADAHARFGTSKATKLADSFSHDDGTAGVGGRRHVSMRTLARQGRVR